MEDERTGPGPLPESALTELLACGLEGEESPFDRLAARLTRDDGPAWLEAQWATELFAGLDPSVAEWPSRAPEREAITELKKRSKRVIREGGDAEGQLAGTLGYLVANVVSLAHHGEKISNLDSSTLSAQLCDFAEVFERPWGDCVEKALRALGS